VSDKQADRVIDRLVAEKEAALAQGRAQEDARAQEKIEEANEQLPGDSELEKSPAVMDLIRKHGKIPDDVLAELGGLELRKGL